MPLRRVNELCFKSWETEPCKRKPLIFQLSKCGSWSSVLFHLAMPDPAWLCDGCWRWGIHHLGEGEKLGSVFCLTLVSHSLAGLKGK